MEDPYHRKQCKLKKFDYPISLDGVLYCQNCGSRLCKVSVTIRGHFYGEVTKVKKVVLRHDPTYPRFGVSAGC